MDVDELMDLASTAVEETFGRSVSYTPQGGAPVQIIADYQDGAARSQLGGDVDLTTTAPRLDCRTATLEAAGVAPRPGDAVGFELRGVAKTARVEDVQRPAPGSTMLILSRLS